MPVVRSRLASACVVIALLAVGPRLGAQDAPAAGTADAARNLVAQLELSRYKESIRGLTRFGDRRQGTDRNRAAIDWIAEQLRSIRLRAGAHGVRVHRAAAALAGERRGGAEHAAPRDRSGPSAAFHAGAEGEPRPDRRQHPPGTAAGFGAACPQCPTRHTRQARAGVLHQDRTPRVPTRCIS